MSDFWANQLKDLSQQQRDFVTTMQDNVKAHKGDVVHLRGDAGTGKTMTVQVLIALLREESFIVLCAAFMANTAQLLELGDTTHRVFGLPLTDDSSELTGAHSLLTLSSTRGKLLANTDLIVIDEVTMLNKELIRMIKEVCSKFPRCNNSTLQDNGWGGRCVIFMGDFKQLGPVITDSATQNTTIEASIVSLPWWEDVRIVTFVQNFRIQDQEYADWVKSVGRGSQSDNFRHTCTLPPWLNSVDDVDSWYHQMCLHQRRSSPEAMLKTFFIAFTHDKCDTHNVNISRSVIQWTRQTTTSLFAINTAKDIAGFAKLMNSTEFFARLSHNSLPPHELNLFNGAIVLIMRNINPLLGATNGQRAIVRHISKYVITLEIHRNSKSKLVDIPRFLFSQKIKQTFTLQRRQFPLQLGYCTTVNKIQGINIPNDGLLGFDMRGSAFAHGHPYVAFSRVKTRHSIVVLRESKGSDTFTNVVSQQLLILSRE